MTDSTVTKSSPIISSEVVSGPAPAHMQATPAVGLSQEDSLDRHPELVLASKYGLSDADMEELLILAASVGGYELVKRRKAMGVDIRRWVQISNDPDFNRAVELYTTAILWMPARAGVHRARLVDAAAGSDSARKEVLTRWGSEESTETSMLAATDGSRGAMMAVFQKVMGG